MGGNLLAGLGYGRSVVTLYPCTLIVMLLGDACVCTMLLMNNSCIYYVRSLLNFEMDTHGTIPYVRIIKFYCVSIMNIYVGVFTMM